MKTLNIKIAYLSIALLLCAKSFCLNSRECPSQDIIKATVQKEIQAGMHLSYDKAEKVEVIFTTDASGKVNLAIAKTDNSALKKAIEVNFMKLSLASLVPDNCYSITINLKLI